MKKNQIIAMFVVLIIVVAAVVGFAVYSTTSDSNNKVLTVATNPDYPNYEYLYGTMGIYAGIDMDIMRAICKELGYTFKPVSVDFNDILNGVADGLYDVGASSITITDERSKIVSFTNHYDESSLMVVAKKELSLKSQSQLYTMKIGVQSDTMAEKFVMNNENFDKSKIVSYVTTSTAIKDLLHENIDCLIMDNVAAKTVASQYSSRLSTFNIIEDNTLTFIGFAVNKNNTKLLEEMNGALERLIANGTISNIKIYYENSNGDLAPYYYR